MNCLNSLLIENKAEADVEVKIIAYDIASVRV